MFKTETENFARLVNTNRAMLIKQLSLLSDNSLSEVSEALTRHAVSHGYVDERFAPKATAVKCWYVNNYAPQWACRSAFDLLCQLGWFPVTNIEKAIAARYLLLNNYSLTFCWCLRLGKWLDVAQNVKRVSSECHVYSEKYTNEN